VEQATPDTPVPEGARVPLETSRRLSESLVWRLQRESYTRRGEQAWLADQVPYYVTSNPFIAGACARVVLGYLRDRSGAGALDLEAPLYVVELAGGSGQFGFLFLKALLACAREIPAMARLRLRYVMTDLATANVEAWRARDTLRPFVEAGLLDFATFDLERDSKISLVQSGETLSAGSLRNPLVVIAHYTFDTTAQDAFWVREGALHEGLVTTSSSREEPDLAEPELLARLSTRYEQRPARDDYYDDEALNRVLAGYRGRLGNTSFLFPIGALRGIRNLMALAGGQLLLLSGDKGYAHESELVACGDPQLTLHGGQCFSMMVNYHAIGLYFRERGGRALHGGTREKRLKLSAFLLGGGEDAFPETDSAFRREIDGFGPCEYYTLAAGIRKQLPAAPLEVILALVKLGGWDPHLVFHFAGPLAEQARGAPEPLRHELVRALEKCWEQFYPMDKDLPFELGRISAALERPADALRFYLESLKRYHEHPATLFNIGLCLYRLQRRREALAYMERALGLNGTYAPAREWRVRIQGELAEA